jgi:FKBP-type peptidyl-prolyl cis-trans isomerase SlpA
VSEQVSVGADTRVTLHFTLRLASGDVIDSTLDRAPATFLFGDESLLPGFERALMGLKAGDRRSILVDPKNGFGERNPENVQVMDRTVFAATPELARGLMISFADKQGQLPGVVVDFNDSHVTVDFNHPLAGRDLTFEVEILAVERHAPAVPVELREAAPRAASVEHKS